MSFVFIDGKRYESVIFSSEAEFESFIIRHADEILWSWLNTGKSIYIDSKKLLRSKAGSGTIPDGYFLWLDVNENNNGISFVEIELSSHSPDKHIIPQILNFKRTLNHHRTRETIIDFFYHKVSDSIKTPIMNKIYAGIDNYKLLKNLLDEDLGVVLVIDDVSKELLEISNDIAKLVESYYILEVKVLVNTESRRKLSPKTKVFGQYPHPKNDEIPEWYSATIRKKIGDKYLVDWTDGDKTNAQISVATPLDEHIILVNEFRIRE